MTRSLAVAGTPPRGGVHFAVPAGIPGDAAPVSVSVSVRRHPALASRPRPVRPAGQGRPRPHRGDRPCRRVRRPTPHAGPAVGRVPASRPAPRRVGRTPPPPRGVSAARGNAHPGRPPRPRPTASSERGKGDRTVASPRPLLPVAARRGPRPAYPRGPRPRRADEGEPPGRRAPENLEPRAGRPAETKTTGASRRPPPFSRKSPP